jgi:hypothetical protein
MASPFAEVGNARLLWLQPGSAPANFRQGPAAVSTTRVVIEAFLRAVVPTSPMGSAAVEGRQSVVNAVDRRVTAWIIRYATVPTGADWLAAGSAWTWTETGLLPAGLGASRADLQCYWGPLPPSLATGRLGVFNLEQVGGDYGTGGIGAAVRAEAGDSIMGSLQFAQ